VLEVVQQSVEPPGVAEIAAQVGIHLNTARFHLTTLENDGIIERALGRASGPGRPPVVYRPRRGQALGEVRRYRALAEVLLSHLAATGDGRAAESAGQAWGAHLVTRPVPNQAVDRDEALSRLTALLVDLDFAPEYLTDWPATGMTPAPDPARPVESRANGIRLRHCPFLELAEPHRNLVCAMHLGLMRGALAELNAPVTVEDLEPFAEPTACLAYLSSIPSQAAAR
jgi:predicted ArsR family transcriptional regulator